MATLLAMAKKNSSLDHAKHNEKVCNYLDKKPEFCDWVITTAFYSGLHYLLFKIFLQTIEVNNKKIKCDSFNKYCAVQGLNRGKYRILTGLVEKYVPDLSPYFNKLKDLSWTARYNNYEYSRDISNDAKKQLKIIKQGCISKTN